MGRALTILRVLRCPAGLLLAACATVAAAGQQTATPGTPQTATTQPAPKTVTTQTAQKTSETMVVLGAAAPVPLAESDSSVMVMPVGTQTLTLESEQNLLRQDSSVFLEERGAGGGQADIVLRGGTFEQALVLLNGFRIDDAQTSHHNLDLPLPFEAMDSIEVLHGAGSTLNGEDALSGVVDFLTAAPARTSLMLRSGVGSYGENEQSMLGALARKQWSARLTARRNFSTGFLANPGYVGNSFTGNCTAQQLVADCQNDRDYRNEDSSLENWLGTRLGVTDLMGAASDRSFGANQFYGPYNSWERTKGWFASARQELGSHTEAAFAYRRHTDDYILARNNPSIYENNHIDGSWQGNVRHTMAIADSSLLLMGLESDGDSINSFNDSNGVTSNALGVHARNRGAGYLDLDLRPAKQRWTLSAGGREEIFSGGGQAVFSPHLAGSLRLAPRLKLRASGGYGFRIPTYTDLYYSDPATVGDPNLKPESAWSGEGGADWAPSDKLLVSATGFYSRQHDTIDYVRTSSAAKWQATNLSGLHFAGVETEATWVPVRSQRVQVGWTGLAGGQASLNGLQSEYALNYPVENVHATWTAALGSLVTVMNTVQIAKVYQQAGVAPWNPQAYPVWDAALTHDAGRVRPYLRLGNVSNTGYQEINGVPMQGRSITGGVTLWLPR
jgi:iron complex outermembrane receptor protein